MQGDLISRSALKELLIEALEKIKKNPTMTQQEVHIICASHMLGDMIDDAPAVDAVPVVHARWIHDINNLYGCSECMGRETMSQKKLKKFCPNCGARMDGEIDA